jgi:hypothetical protein
MTRDDIIRLAREAGAATGRHSPYQKNESIMPLCMDVERFAALVAAPLEEEIRRLRFCIPEGDAAAAMEYLAYCVEKAVAEEREACAKVCEDIPLPKDGIALTHLPTIEACAAAIRARG